VFTTIPLAHFTANKLSTVNVTGAVPSDHKNDLSACTVALDHKATEFHTVDDHFFNT
jgi:hypothetical protein